MPWMRHRAATLLVTLRSSVVGMVATLTDLVALTILVEVARLPARMASLPALILGVAIQFVGNKLFAFRDRSPAWLEQAAAFALVESLGVAANFLLFDLAMALGTLPYLPVRMVTTFVVYFGVCLPLWGRIFAPTNLAARPADRGGPPRDQLR
jgi:putative flippase GtrA